MSLHELTAEQREIRDLAARFADERIAPHAAEWDREHTFPRELFADLGDLGLMGVCVPEEHGGAGADFLAYVLVLEELSRADAGVGVTVAVHTSACALPLLANGGERWVPGARRRRGDRRLRADRAGLRLGRRRAAHARDRRPAERHEAVGHQRLARRDDRRLRARRRRRPRQRLRRPRRRAGPRGPARGRRSSGCTRPRPPTSRSTARPASGSASPGRACGSRSRTLDAGRIGIAAQAVGIAQAALDLAAGYAQERHAFGAPIARLGAIQQKLADMQTEIEAARALVWRAARLKDAGLPHTVEGAQAKLFASGVARRQTGEAIQVLGGYGYTTEFPAERYYRDAKITEIYEGTSEIQRLVIARALLGDAIR